MYKLEALTTGACISLCYFVPADVKGHKFNFFSAMEGSTELLKHIVRDGLKLALITTACLSQYASVTKPPMQAEEASLRNKSEKHHAFIKKCFSFELLTRQ